MRVTVGCDPEFQLIRGTEYVSAHDLVPGTKDKPHPVKQGAVQADGTAVEFNIAPAETKEEFVSNITTVLGEIRKLIPEDYAFSFKPAVEFPQVYWDSLPGVIKEIGCDPDYTQYDAVNARNPPQRPGTLACYGGHLHVGWGKDYDVDTMEHRNDCLAVVGRFEQAIHYLSPVIADNTKRQKMYGVQGEWRPKPYGVELRSLSCDWLSKPHLWPWLFDFVKWSVVSVAEEHKLNGHVEYAKDPETRHYGVYIKDPKKKAYYADLFNSKYYGEAYPRFPVDLL